MLLPASMTGGGPPCSCDLIPGDSVYIPSRGLGAAATACAFEWSTSFSACHSLSLLSSFFCFQSPCHFFLSPALPTRVCPYLYSFLLPPPRLVLSFVRFLDGSFDISSYFTLFLFLVYLLYFLSFVKEHFFVVRFAFIAFSIEIYSFL